MTPPLVKRRSSLILRGLLLYAALFSVLVAGVLALVSWTTLVHHESAADRELEEEARRLHDQLAGRTETQMVAVISRTAAGGTTLVMLATERREYLAGNLRAWPPLHEAPATTDRGDRLRHLGYWSDGRPVRPPIVTANLATVPRVLPFSLREAGG